MFYYSNTPVDCGQWTAVCIGGGVGGGTLITFCHCGQMVRQLGATLEQAMVHRAENQTCLLCLMRSSSCRRTFSFVIRYVFAIHIHRGSLVAVDPRSVN